MKKVLVTGATGFIGQYVIEHLLYHKCTVIATSADEQKAADASWYARVQYIPLDIATPDADSDYFRYFRSPDLMIHLAWPGLPNYKSSFHTDVNLPVQLSFLKNMIAHGLKDLTVTGTCFEYGMQEGALSEEMPSYPANPYAIAKDSLRKALEDLQRSHPFVLKWARLFYMYGKGQNPNSLLSQLDKALSDNEPVFNMSGGEQVRDFLPVEKVGEYIVRIALQKRVTGIINCCSGNPVTVRQFVERYLEMKHKSIKLNPGYYPYPDYEPMRFWGDTAKLKSILNEP